MCVGGLCCATLFSRKSPEQADIVLRDIRVALRNFAREPGFAAVLVLTIRRVGELLPAYRASRVDPLSSLRYE